MASLVQFSSRVLLLLATTFGSLAYAIEGGVAAHRSSVVAIVYSLSNYQAFWCSGVLISPRHVLTAAHCVPPNLLSPIDQTTKFDLSPSHIKIYLGDGVEARETNDISLPFVMDQSKLLKDVELLSVTAIDRHPYSLTPVPGSQTMNGRPWGRDMVDLAILTLSASVDAKPAVLPESQISLEQIAVSDSGDLVASGFGISHSDSGGKYPYHFGVKMQYEPRVDISSIVPLKAFGCAILNVTAAEFVGTRNHDSGSPLFLSGSEGDKVIGILRGPPEPYPGVVPDDRYSKTGGAYTFLPPYVAWIKSITGN